MDCVQSRKSRQTGTVVSVWRPGSQAEESEGWLLICEDHGGCLGTETRSEATAWAPYPNEWCPFCQGEKEVEL